ncbi:MAG: hypothetical protein NW207_06565 [Cytophagales bacterium]|nr:hypothetical protein [Cytophagales bacterium]
MLLTDLEVYEALREKMDEKQARSLIHYIEIKVEGKFEQAQTVFSTKEDIHRVELQIAQMKNDTELKIAEMKNDTERIIAGMKVDLEHKLADMKVDLEHKLADMKVDLEHKIADMKIDLERKFAETHQKIAETHQKIAETHQKIAESKNELIKWLFALIFGSTIGIIGTILTVMKMGGW